MPFSLNATTGCLDLVRGASWVNSVEIDPLSLHLDQTTHQHVTNGTPVFDEGISILAGKKLILDGG